MGSCAGKANSSAVVSAHIQPVDPNNPPPNYQAAPHHNENQQQVPQPNKYEEPQKQHNPNQYIVQHNETQNQYQQPQPQPHRDEHSNHNTKLEEKPKHGEDDLDEDAFASQLKKKEAPKMATEKKKENNLAGDAFALNFPANQFINNDNAKKEGKVIEENKRYQSKNKEKNVKNIIDNPDEMEQSFSSHGEARNIIGKGDDDDFDVVENTKQKSHRAIDTHTHHKNRESLNIQQPNRASLTESASPSSGVIKNKTPEKEKVIEVKETRPHIQEQHYHHEEIHHEPEHNDHHEIIYHEEENNEPHEIIFHEEENNDNHEIIFHNHDEQHEHHGHQERYEPEYIEEKHHHEPSYVQEKKVHKEEEPFYHSPKKHETEKIHKSPERVLEARKENIEEPMMEFDDPPLKIIDTPKKKEIASPQKNHMKVSQEKMPWERNSVPNDDENEIEFFDDELES